MKAVCALSMAVLLMAPSLATAQGVPYDSSIEVQLFEPALGPHSYLTVDGAATVDKGQYRLSMLFTYLTRPFTIYNASDTMIGDPRARVVETMIGGQIYGSYGIAENMHVGLAVPLVLSMTGEGLDPDTAEPAMAGLSVRGLRDARLEFAYRFYESGAISMSAIPALTLPTSTALGSQDNAWLGDDLPSFRPRVAVEWRTPGGAFGVAGNVGLLLRKQRTLYSSQVGSQLTYGVAARFHLHHRVGLVAEAFGRKGLRSDVDESPLEIDGGIKVRATSSLSVMLGGGAGVLKGIGSPAVRVFAAVTFAPDFTDSDGDGVANMSDRCPMEKEDRDGFEDSDGCPDLDNDKDFIEDFEDKCPNKAEDKDGFEDEDGCPDLDNDKDGIADIVDKCPMLAEDKKGSRPADGCPLSAKDSDGDGINDAIDKCPDQEEDEDGFEDGDGCPEADNDKDGLLDGDDKCPLLAEDKDGYQDGDGCPDIDNDGDGVLDKQDRCPDKRETINGVKDGDGCPDRGGKVRARFDGKRIVFAKKVKLSGSRVGRRAKKSLAQAALHILAHAEVTKWRIVVIHKKKGGDKAKAKADAEAKAVMGYFVKQGVPAARLEAFGAIADSARFIITAVEIDESKKPVRDEVTEDDIEFD